MERGGLGSLYATKVVLSTRHITSTTHPLLIKWVLDKLSACEILYEFSPVFSCQADAQNRRQTYLSRLNLAQNCGLPFHTAKPQPTFGCGFAGLQANYPRRDFTTSTAFSAPLAGAAGISTSSAGLIPSFLRSSLSMRPNTSLLSFRKFRTFSRPWPMRSPW